MLLTPSTRFQNRPANMDGRVGSECTNRSFASRSCFRLVRCTTWSRVEHVYSKGSMSQRGLRRNPHKRNFDAKSALELRNLPLRVVCDCWLDRFSHDGGGAD